MKPCTASTYVVVVSMGRMCWIGSPPVSYWLVLGGLLFGGYTGGPSGALAQDAADCDTTLTRAQQAYYAAEFEAAASRLRPCAQRRSLPDSVRVRVYRLLSFVYLGQNDEPAARQAVESLLDLQPTYSPDPAQDRPDFVALVEAAKKRRRARAEADEDENRRWVRWTLGAAAAVLGTAAVLLLGGDDSGDGREPLPAPQPPPE